MNFFYDLKDDMKREKLVIMKLLKIQTVCSLHDFEKGLRISFH